jgi:hypothetical protein
MLKKVFGYGMVGLLAVALVAGTVYILLHPAEVQAGQGASGRQGWNVATQPGARNRGDGSEALSQGGNGRGSLSQRRGDSINDGTARGQGQRQGSGVGLGAGGATGTVVWETVTGEVTVVDSEITLQTTEGEVVVGLGQSQYREEAGFVLEVRDEISVTGFYEDGELKAGTVENLTTGETIVLRDEAGRPTWAGGGWLKNQRQPQ